MEETTEDKMIETIIEITEDMKTSETTETMEEMITETTEIVEEMITDTTEEIIEKMGMKEMTEESMEEMENIIETILMEEITVDTIEVIIVIMETMTREEEMMEVRTGTSYQDPRRTQRTSTRVTMLLP